ncbi:MAG: porin family protein [Lachnoclostridium sp.]|nr:porin family protein [Lachnoclostridium sp.]
MKKFLLLAVMAVMTLGVSAQAHRWYAGGQVTFGKTTDSTSGVKTTQVTVLPEAGYNFTDVFSVGTTVGVSYRKSDGKEKTVFTIDPYARYKFYKYDRLTIFVDGGVDLGIGRADGSTAVQFGIGFRPGLLFDLNDKFSLVAHIGFLGYQGGNNAAKRNGAPENWGLNFDTNNLMFGISYNF